MLRQECPYNTERFTGYLRYNLKMRIKGRKERRRKRRKKERKKEEKGKKEEGGRNEREEGSGTEEV